jgi:fused signal recognition particle receptor
VKIFEKIKKGLLLTHDDLLLKLKKAFQLGGGKEFEDLLEEILQGADLGPLLVQELFEKIKKAKDLESAKVIIKEELKGVFDGYVGPKSPEDFPYVVILLGVNGSGKTTFAAKLGYYLKKEGFDVLLSASDTFRAAAIEQLQEWGRRASIPVISKNQGSDPASVLYESIEKAKNLKRGVVICDTAGRLHTKHNLMQEMAKIIKVAGKAKEGAPHQTILVLDATTGQNGLKQAEEFKGVAPITGLAITKLDGTAKGGIAVSIVQNLKIPIHYVSVGEGLEDFSFFSPEDYINNLLD